jgi:osmotically-inducible protein OsmY
MVLTMVSVLVLGTSGAYAAAAPGGAADPGPYPPGKIQSDSAITIAVENALLHDDGVFPNEVDVTTKQGTVTLTGSVDNLLAKDQVVAIAESLRGVRGVINLVTVTPVSRPDGDIRKDLLSALLQDPATDSYQVQAAISRGVVIVTGMVTAFEEKQLVERIIKGVRGVVEIHNNVTIATVGGAHRWRDARRYQGSNPMGRLAQWRPDHRHDEGWPRHPVRHRRGLARHMAGILGWLGPRRPGGGCQRTEGRCQ